MDICVINNRKFKEVTNVKNATNTVFIKTW